MAQTQTATITMEEPMLLKEAPADLTKPADLSKLKGQTILITGGASGLGEGMFRAFAKSGANVIIGDLNVKRGEALVQEVRKLTGNDNLHFLHCNVTSFASQTQMFKKALALSPTHTINSVIANAGVGKVGEGVDLPFDIDVDPPEPDMTTLTVNLVGVVYTTRLAMHHFRRCGPNEDQHLLFVGSMSSFVGAPGIMGLYTASKHGVLGWFRGLRIFAGTQATKVRINMICPYFVDTPILPKPGRLMLAGIDLTEAEDVVEASARLQCSKKAHGRCLAVAPRVSGGIMEVKVDTIEQVELFTQRLMFLLRTQTRLEGIYLWIRDAIRIIGLRVLASVFLPLFLGLLVIFR